MVDSSKILTVSYGTFSCTLEGFDDSFSTMKAIAEYFRDLAAGDRYFGAEPPTPDAEMLTRIAEREIARRVEMRTSGDGIVLRALDAVQPAAPSQPLDAVTTDAFPAPTAAAPAPQPAAAPRVAAPHTAPNAPPAMPPVPQPPHAAAQGAIPAPPRAEAPAHPDPESVAAKLQRIRAAVGQTAPQPAAYVEDIEDAQEMPDTTDRAAAPDAALRVAVAAQPDATRPVADAVDQTPPTTFPLTESELTESELAGAELAEAQLTGSPLSDAETDAAIARAVASFDDASLDDARQEANRNGGADAALPAPQSPDAPAPQDHATGGAGATATGPKAAGDMAAGNMADDTDTQIDAVLRNLERAGLRQPRRDDADPTGSPVAAPVAVTATAATTNVSGATVPAAPQALDGPAIPRARILRVTRRPRTPDDAAMTAALPTTATDTVTADTAALMAAVAAATQSAATHPGIAAAVPQDAPRAGDMDHSASDAADGIAARTDLAGADLTGLDSMGLAPTGLASTGLASTHLASTGNRGSDAAGTVPTGGADVADDGLAPQASAGSQDDAADDRPRAEPLDDAPAASATAQDTAAVPLPTPTPMPVSVATLDGADDLTGFDMAARSTLSTDDEADLQRTLAALNGLDTAQPATPRVLRDPAAEGRIRREPLHGASEAEMSRIMTQADAQLADPGASRRRDAIAHLKAAVAATEAARQLGEDRPARDRTEGVFRQDLDQVVRPRRAEPRADSTTDRPRPAPLKLVASQRIDLGRDAATADQTPVQPRRVSVTPAPAGKPTAPATSFAAYAKALGATGLPDLLEAAAAYTAFVERSEDFSRPHIMQKVRETSDTEFSREDGLRSFGTLLRQGRIERVRNGRFAVSDQIRFRPDQIAADGR